MQQGQLASGGMCPPWAGQQLEGRAERPFASSGWKPCTRLQKNTNEWQRDSYPDARQRSRGQRGAHSEAHVASGSSQRVTALRRAPSAPRDGQGSVQPSQDLRVSCKSEARNLRRERRRASAVGRNICWAPYHIINDWNQVEAKDGWRPLGKAPHVCQADLRRPSKEIDRIT